jgi:hypothetical protein
MANDFCDIPQELQIHILSNLDAVSLIRCAMVRQCIAFIICGKETKAVGSRTDM